MVVDSNGRVLGKRNPDGSVVGTGPDGGASGPPATGPQIASKTSVTADGTAICGSDAGDAPRGGTPSSGHARPAATRPARAAESGRCCGGGGGGANASSYADCAAYPTCAIAAPPPP